MEAKTKKADVGVIIARFQTPDLHEAHHSLIKTVMSKHKKVLILLGSTTAKVTRNNPLDFFTRRMMINADYPDIIVLPIRDFPTDEGWSNDVDKQIRSVFDMESVVCYGSRDSAIPSYSGKFPTVELESSQPALSGSEIRQLASEQVRASSDFRAGVVYAAFNKYANVFPTVDAVIYKKETKEILMGRKKDDVSGKWRFPGGHVDVSDDSKEDAVKREAREETHLSAWINEPVYIGSCKVPDYRYKKEVDVIMTSLFLMDYQSGIAKAGDDLVEVRWFKIDELNKNEMFLVIDDHKPLLALLNTHIQKEQ